MPGMNYAAIEQLITQRIADAMTTYEANRDSKNETHNEASGSAEGVEHTVHNCSYKEFLTCWFENMESVFHISIVLRTARLDAAYEMTWKELKQMMIDEYCLRNEVQKMEIEL
nr:hypothetical protein [Tanacetum cinerariifolium]